MSDSAKTSMIKEFEEFSRYKATQSALFQSAEHLESGRYNKINELMEAAKATSITNLSPFRMLRPSETAFIAAPTYIIKPWLMRDTVTAVFGPSQSFKSFFCLEAALCIATGTDFNGYPVKKEPVIYIAAEGETGIAMRIDAWRAAHPHVEIDDEFLSIITQPVSILDPTQVDRLISWIKSEQKRVGRQSAVIFIDTLSQCIAGADEDGAQSASLACAEMIRIRRETGCTVCFVHHTGKDVSRGMRGSSAYFANCDAAIEIVRDGRPEEPEMTACASVKKMKDGSMGHVIPFGCVVTKIPRLIGSEIDISLVVDFTIEKIFDDRGAEKEAEKQAKKAKKQSAHIREMFVLFDEVGSKLSVRQIAKQLWQDTDFYKKRVTDAFGLLVPVDVMDEDGNILGTVIRRPTDGTSYGEITRIK